MWTLIYIVLYLTFCLFLCLLATFLEFYGAKYKDEKFSLKSLLCAFFILFIPVINLIFCIAFMVFLYTEFLSEKISNLFKKIDKTINDKIKGE